MLIKANLTKKYIDIWLAQGEAPPDLREFRKRYADYELVIWRSGSGNVAALTSELLCSNN